MGIGDGQRLVLASGSPRRRELLARLGLQFEVLASDVDESIERAEDPRRYVLRLARTKAEQVARQRSGALILAADTAVVLDDRILGKPRDEEEARAMLRQLSGRDHRVLTAVALIGTRDAAAEPVIVETRVVFGSLSEEEIGWYVATGEPFDKAGAYGIQGIAGAFVRSIEGSASNVIGLPLVETIELLARAGFELPWSRR